MTSSPCPADAALRLLLEGQEAPTDLSEHINACEVCQQRLDQLAAGDTFAQGVAERLRDGRHDATEIAAAIDHIRRATPLPASDDLGVPPGLVTPSSYPGALGRLGQYELLQVLGRGGMGTVFKAYDPSLHRVVAIKLLAPHLAHNPVARKRFVREAQAAAAVSHDHVVTIHAIDEIAEQPAIVMQYIQGRSLQQKLDAEGPLPLNEILRIGLQTAAGLAAAHAQGLVHRDVKPANILLENGVQRVRLTDFGLARTVDDYALTASGVIAGTPQYMSPEQAQGDAVTPRSDLFSLGCVMYAMCTGNSPFRASTAMGVLKKVCEASPRPIRDVNPEVPDWLCEIIDRLLAKDCTQRFSTAREVAELLEKWLAHIQQPLAVARPGPLSPETHSTASTDTSSPRTAPSSQRADHRRPSGEPPGEQIGIVPDSTTPASPVAVTVQQTTAPARVCDLLRGPAWGLMILGALGAFITLGVYVALVRSVGIEVLGCEPSGWGLPILHIILLLLVFGFGFLGIFLGGRRLTLLHGFWASVLGCVLAWLIPPTNVAGLPLGIWGLVLLRRREVRDVYEAHRALESTAPENPKGLALLRERVSEPAVALLLTGVLNWLFLAILVLITLQGHLRHEFAFRQLIVPQYPTLIVLAVVFAITSTITAVAGLRMLHLRSYRLALTGSACAAVTLPGVVVGIPVATWALVTLMQRDVRAAFAATCADRDVPLSPGGPQAWRRPWFWILSGAIAVGAGPFLWMGFRPAKLWSTGSSTDSLETGAAETQRPPRSVTLSRPDDMVPIGRTDVRRMVVSPGGAFLAAAGGSDHEGFVKIWNAQTLQELGLQTSAHTIHSIAYGDHGRVLATGEADGTIRVRDGKNGAVLWEVAAHSTPVTAVEFGGPGEGLVSGGEDGSVRLWMNRRSSPVDLPGPTSAVLDLASTRDGARIAAACRDGVVHLWNGDGEPVMQLTYRANPLQITLDEVDGQLAVALESGTCEVLSFRERRTTGRWFLSTGATSRDLRTAYWRQPAVAVFITASDDGKIRLLDFSTFRESALLQSTSPALGADLIAGQDRIVSAHADGHLRFWNLNRP